MTVLLDAGCASGHTKHDNGLHGFASWLQKFMQHEHARNQLSSEITDVYRKTLLPV